MKCRENCRHKKEDSYFFVDLCTHPAVVKKAGTPDTGVHIEKVEECPLCRDCDEDAKAIVHYSKDGKTFTDLFCESHAKILAPQATWVTWLEDASAQPCANTRHRRVPAK